MKITHVTSPAYKERWIFEYFTALECVEMLKVVSTLREKFDVEFEEVTASSAGVPIAVE